MKNFNLQQLSGQIQLAIAQETERLMRASLDAKLGKDKWTMEDVATNGERYMHKGYELYVYKETPICYITHSIKHAEDGTILVKVASSDNRPVGPEANQNNTK